VTAGLWLLVGAVAWVAGSFPIAVLVGKVIHLADPGENGPDGTAGDLLADQPDEIRADGDAEFWALVGPIEAERDRRLS